MRSSTLKSWFFTQAHKALSAAEAELHAMSKCAQQIGSMLSIVTDLDIKLNGMEHRNSAVALQIAYRRGLGGKARHVKVAKLWIPESIGVVRSRDRRERQFLNPGLTDK